MKKVLLLLVAVLTMSAAQGQEYKRWSLEGNFGMHAVGDESATVRDNYNHFDGVLKYNVNRTVALGASYGKDNLSLFNYDGGYVNTEYNRYNMEMFVDIFDVLDLQNNFITVIGHGGGGISTIDAHETDYYQSVFNMRGGLSLLFKLHRNVALKFDASTTVNISQDKTLDGFYDISNAGINSTVDNATVGVVLYLGKKGRSGKKLQHADWSVKEPEKTIVKIIERTPVINKTDQYTVNLNYVPVEFVYFENDLPKVGQEGEDAIGIQGLNAIEKMATFLKKNPDANIELTGSASPTKSTTSEYDTDLSERRVNTVKDRLVKLGVSPSRIGIGFIGKFDERDNLHEFARRVSMFIVK